jgi:hypothetical protein
MADRVEHAELNSNSGLNFAFALSLAPMRV